MSKITLEQCVDLLDRLAYPERYKEESCCQGWYTGDGPFEAWADKIADRYKQIVEGDTTK